MPTLTYGARTATSIAINITAGGGETQFELEASRSADFTSDESIVRSPLNAGTTVFNDLVEDTPYYFRARPPGAGYYSPTIMVGTTTGTARIPYTGFSIEPAILVVPEPLVDMSATNLEAGSLVDNLTNDDPMSTLRVAGASSSIVFRTRGTPIDTFCMLGSLANEAVTWRIRGASSQANLTSAPSVDTGTVAFRVNQGIGRRRHYHAYRRLSQPYAQEWWQIDVAGFSTFFMARHLVAGLARQSVNISRGQGREPNDLGSVSRTLFGGADRVVGWRGKKVDFPLSWLREAEFEAKWSDLDLLVGTTDPVLALPNPKLSSYLNDRIAYGEILNMRAEVMRGDRYSRSLEINSLY